MARRKNEIDMQRIGERIRIIRELRQETQEDLASAIGVPRTTLKEWETGRRTVNVHDLQLLSRHLGCSADYLICLSDVASPDLGIQAGVAATGLTEAAVSAVAGLSSSRKSMLSAVLTDVGLPALLTRFLSLQGSVAYMLQAFDRGWKQNLEDEEKLRHMESVLSDALGFRVSILPPKWGALQELSAVTEVTRGIAERVSGYAVLSPAVRIDSTLSADPAELSQYLAAKVPAPHSTDGHRQPSQDAPVKNPDPKS